MCGIISFGNKRSYEDFKRQIPSKVQELFDSLRDFCLSIEGNVVEDVRMHRVVFCKSISFRWFVDAEPAPSSILLKIQRNRKEPITKIEIKNLQELEGTKEMLKEAFFSIH